MLDRFEVLESKSGCTKGLVSGQDSIMLTGTVRTNAPFRWQLFLERVGFEIQDSYYGPVRWDAVVQMLLICNARLMRIYLIECY